MMVTEQEAQGVTQDLDVRTAFPEHVDLVFVFGTRHPEPAYTAPALIKRRVGDIAVLTGGTDRATGADETSAHLEIMLRRGVPQERVIVEDASTNTLENVTVALPRIGARVDLEKLGAVGVVTKWHHCRRAMMTPKSQLPAGIRYIAVTYEPEGIARSNWWRGERECRRVLKERDRIPRYPLSGHVAEIAEDNGAFV